MPPCSRKSGYEPWTWRICKGKESYEKPIDSVAEQRNGLHPRRSTARFGRGGEKNSERVAKHDRTRAGGATATEGEQVRNIYDATQNAALPTAKAAADTYRGLAFRQMNREILLSPFARDGVRILSALYGPIAPDAPINPYRLDFTKSLSVEGEPLKSLQKKNFTDKLANCRIYNLASKEFSERIDKKKMAQWIDVEFYMDPNMKKRAPSATCKKLRGRLAAHLIAMESFEEKAFAAFRCDGFHLLSSDERGHYVYVW